MSEYFDVASRLQTHVGEKGLVNIKDFGEVGFTIVHVEPPANLAANVDFEQAFQWSEFTVLLDNGLSIDIDGTGPKSTVSLSGHRIYWPL